MEYGTVMSDKASSTRPASEPLRVGISSCLLGAEVRFDGGHKHDRYITGMLAKHFELIPICPEMAIGLGKPREPIRLVRTEGGVRARGSKSHDIDVTDPLREYAHRMAGHVGNLSGYLWKRASPSCGMERVKVYDESGMPSNNGRGTFAEVFMAAHPLMPCEEEGRLNDPVLRENFITRVFVRHRWLTMVTSGLTLGRLVGFHTDHKFLLLAHDQAAYRRMGRLVARADALALDTIAARYAAELMEALKRPAGRRQHGNVLQRLLGFVSRRLSNGDRREMVELIERYRQGNVPLIVPLTLLNHHFRRRPSEYVGRQHYLQPHPAALALRNVL